ncbi:hypothetical protein [Puniceibacterium sediminis]|uniref:Muramidase (Phage lambda lysozyme) n=1 Tax=Puniceibacterium sediminis TaxID=1608407 RepID=A0A238XKI2_9RHOB|nr:hypothetical protein [Puniceibacterium sediminis]SNR59526.1 hypothetical protein SAMN06265370_1125 [Puniceibacterium sediminis]
MNLKGTVVALSLVAVFATENAQAETATLTNFRSMKGGGIEFTLSTTETQSRIYLNSSMIKKSSGQPGRDIPIGAGAGSSAHLKHLIGWAESGRSGYDAVQNGARVRPGKRPTQMTIGEIYQWISATPGQPHAIGRYQFIPSTLKSLVHELGLTRDTLFTDHVQDLLADILLEDAGYSGFMAGQISRHRFMENLARIWAGFPTSTGRSYYHGHAGNRAVITWNEFDTHMKKIFPRHSG